jgi:hypothetical protein
MNICLSSLQCSQQYERILFKPSSVIFSLRELEMTMHHVCEIFFSCFCSNLWPCSFLYAKDHMLDVDIFFGCWHLDERVSLIEWLMDFVPENYIRSQSLCELIWDSLLENQVHYFCMPSLYIWFVVEWPRLKKCEREVNDLVNSIDFQRDEQFHTKFSQMKQLATTQNPW